MTTQCCLMPHENCQVRVVESTQSRRLDRFSDYPSRNGGSKTRGCYPVFFDALKPHTRPVEFGVFRNKDPRMSFRGRWPAPPAWTHLDALDVPPRNLGCLHVERRPAEMRPNELSPFQISHRTAKHQDPSGGHLTLTARIAQGRVSDGPRDDRLYLTPFLRRQSPVIPTPRPPALGCETFESFRLRSSGSCPRISSNAAP